MGGPHAADGHHFKTASLTLNQTLHLCGMLEPLGDIMNHMATGLPSASLSIEIEYMKARLAETPLHPPPMPFQ